MPFLGVNFSFLSFSFSRLTFSLALSTHFFLLLLLSLRFSLSLSLSLALPEPFSALAPPALSSPLLPSPRARSPRSLLNPVVSHSSAPLALSVALSLSFSLGLSFLLPLSLLLFLALAVSCLPPLPAFLFLFPVLLPTFLRRPRNLPISSVGSLLFLLLRFLPSLLLVCSLPLCFHPPMRI